MRKLKSIVFSTLVLGQLSLLAAEKPHDFARWEKEISAFEASDKTNPPPAKALLFIGSSTIRFWSTLSNDFPGVPLINRGFGGSEVVDSTHFADRIVFPYNPRAIFFRAGGNDLAAGRTPEGVFEDYRNFVLKVHEKLPKTKIYFIGWAPTPSRWKQADKEKELNSKISALSAGKDYLGYIECYDLPLDPQGKPRPELFRADRLHFNDAGYKLLVDRVRPFVQAESLPKK